jgi:prepilin-type N-terminal cleavage/methylation domain-containing protein
MRAVRADAGFSLLEVMVAIAVFSAITATVFTVLRTGQRSFDMGVAYFDVHRAARSAMDQIAQEFRSASANTVLFPTTDSIYFQKSTGYSGGVPTWSNPICFYTAMDAREMDNGIDDDNDGLVDERVLMRREDLPPYGLAIGPEDKTATVSRFVGDAGLSFTLVSANEITVYVSLTRLDSERRPASVTVWQTVLLRN